MALKLLLHRYLEAAAFALLVHGSYPRSTTLLAQVAGWLDAPAAADPPPTIDLPFGPLRPAPEVEWSALPAFVGPQIHTLGPTEVIIDRATVQTILANLPMLMTRSTLVPVQEGKRVIGVRIFGAGADSLLTMLNIQSGDLLQNINGYDMGIPDQALQAFIQLRRAPDLSAHFKRGNHPIVLHYSIR